MKIGLALGGGGVLGVAHLALLEKLEKNGIKIDIVAGTSAGSVVGALYSYGGVEMVTDFLKRIKEKDLFSKKRIFFNLNPDTFFKKIEEILSDLMPDAKFSNLNIDLVLLATDIDSGEPVELSRGSLVKSIMASSAYPGVFPLQEINGLRLSDGGITNNLPSDILKKKGCDYIIASSLNTLKELKDKKPLNRAQVVSRALDIMLYEQEKIQVSSADFCYLPPVEGYRWYNFDKFEEILAKSRDYASKAVSEIKQDIESKRPKGFFARLFSG